MQELKIANVIIEFLIKYSALDLNEICRNYGILCDQSLDPMHSKEMYVKSGINKLNSKQLQEVALKIIKENECAEFVKSLEGYLDQEPFEISMITRRNIIDWILSKNKIEGKLELNVFLNRIWDLKHIPSKYGEDNAETDIIRHVIFNGDLSYEEMFQDLGDVYISDFLFKKLVEQLVSPLVRKDKEEQSIYVDELNEELLADGFNLVQNDTMSGRPIYTLEKVGKGINNSLKNIIFASINKKPDIVISDSLSNDIEIIDNENNECLVYNLPIGREGLTWDELIVWWNKGKIKYSILEEKSLYERLKESLDSEPEKRFLKEYYNYIHGLGNHMPALIPQVYCHYDARSAKYRRGNIYVHQRMDFLMIIKNGVRVVIEIDGKQHYSENDKANPGLYAKMVKDDRELKLYGYDVYRFGGYEFLEDQQPSKMIKSFIDNLFKKYEIL